MSAQAPAKTVHAASIIRLRSSGMPTVCGTSASVESVPLCTYTSSAMKKTDWQDWRERYEIRDCGPEIGEGLFARVTIKKGEFILEYVGEKIPTATADESPSRYLFEVNTRWTIDGEALSNTARYINHCCKPNVEAEIEKGHINIYALRDIAPGEELTIDYGDEYMDEFIRPVGCKCTECARKASLQALNESLHVGAQ